MKVYKLFTMAMAAMAFAACSDNDVIDDQKPDNQAPDNWEANMEGLTINFGTATGPKTRDYSGETPSEGTEALIYDAYVFAREANPGHQNPLEGDWTVIKCEVNKDGIVTGKEDPVTNDDGTKTIKNVATFRGVRQGDFVYVVANDPNMNLDLANSLAHQGAKSEEKIKGYTSMLAKEYLGGLNYGAKVTVPNGKFIMGGLAQIPVAPTLPSNGTFELEIGLDRELSKVLFQANVTAVPSDAAYQQVEFRPGDGIVVARIAPTTSMFAEREANFYVPFPTCTEDWPINDHSWLEEKGVYSKYCDQTIEGSKMFDGMYVTDAKVVGHEKAQVWNGVTLGDKFNMTNPAGDVQEYRYSWILPEGSTVGESIVYGTQDQNLMYGNTKSLYSSTFYTTPNYGANTNGATVICTQATYIGKDEFMFDELNKLIDKVVTYNEDAIKFQYGPNADKDFQSIPNPFFMNLSADLDPEKAYSANKASTDKLLATLKAVIGYDSKKIGAGFGLKYYAAPKDETKDEFAAQVKANGLSTEAEYFALKETDPAVIYEDKMTLGREQYDDLMDKFYLALILHYRASQPNTKTIIGDMLTELGNKVMKDRKAYFYDPALMPENAANTELLPTDYLLLGNEKEFEYQLYTKNEAPIVRAFDYTGYTPAADKTKDTPIFCIYDSSAAEDGSATDFYNRGNLKFDKGKDLRLAYFGSADAFNYFTNMKLYYRADLANYVGNVSNKITERNMYYRTIGTIQSLGARTIHDAIYSEENTMKVNVTVNKWKLSINQIPM